MLGDHRRADAAADVEFRREAHESRPGDADQGVQDFVRHRFMEGAAVPERPDVELQRLQFHAQRVRHVFQLECREVRLARFRTQASEFRQRHANHVIAGGRGIRECLEGLARNGPGRRGGWHGKASSNDRQESILNLHYRAIAVPCGGSFKSGVPSPMRLTKVKLAGFKSFIDPTTISFPSNLTGVVGPNGCGKSNIIDAVRWVMGEISAKHLRGDSMADVIFNGSATRKPLGAASVELVFDNSEGKIGGAYASYNEVSLRRAVSRDGTSDYFINGTKVRRKDITQLFLGTGLGSRSYAIIEQGMISRVIEARPDDLRAFLEEAAGISRYKERRRETENRIGQTRENLDRLNDLREEVDKQIRHLQRQAATARRYQTLKEEERKLQAELLALRLQSLDTEAEVRDTAVQHCETALQAVLADLRHAEAEIEQIRVDQSSKAEALRETQARYYGAGSEVTRIEQSIGHARELRQRQTSDFAQSQAQVQDLAGEIQRDLASLESLSAELAAMIPSLDAAHAEERSASDLLVRSEQALGEWQHTWDEHSQSVARGQGETQVECARIEQLENQQRRLLQQQERQEAERLVLVQVPAIPLEALEAQA